MKEYRVGIDGNEANVVNRVGSNVYAWELLQSMYQFLQKERLFSVTVYLSSEQMGDWPPETKWWRYQVITPNKLWTQWRLPLELYQHRDIDLFFSPGHYLPRWSPVPTVPTIMDLAFLYYPDFFIKRDLLQLSAWTARSVKQARHIFAISESTRNDIAQHYGRPKSDISVIYPAVKKVKKLSTAQVSDVLSKHGISSPYIIFVGTLQPRKNIERLVSAFEVLVDKGWNGSLVLAGKTGWLGEPIQERISRSKHAQKIIQTGFVSDTDKTALVQGAQCSVLVGLYEGFGIPPLESINLGTIPVVSQSSSLPEVVGTGGVFVDPLSEKSIADGLWEIVNLNESQQSKRLGQMVASSSRFSWEDSAQKAARTLYGLLSGTHVL